MMRPFTEVYREQLEAIERAKEDIRQCESGDRRGLDSLKTTLFKLESGYAAWRRIVVEDFLLQVRFVMEDEPLALSNLLDGTYPNLQTREMICNMNHLAQAIAALEAKAKP